MRRELSLTVACDRPGVAVDKENDQTLVRGSIGGRELFQALLDEDRMTISYRGDGISLLISWGDCARGATAVALKSVGKIGPTKSLPIRLRTGRGSDPKIS